MSANRTDLADEIRSVVREVLREELAGRIPQLLDVKRVAEALSVTPWQIYRLLDQQEIESVYIGRRRLVVAESLRSYVEELPRWPQSQ